MSACANLGLRCTLVDGEDWILDGRIHIVRDGRSRRGAVFLGHHAPSSHLFVLVILLLVSARCGDDV